MSAPQDARSEPQAEWLADLEPADFRACPRCGGRSYTWGHPMPGEARPMVGELDTRERHMRTCCACGHEWPQGAWA